MTLAAIDRLVHHATILEMNVESYRRRAALESKRGAGRPQRARQSRTTPDRRTATINKRHREKTLAKHTNQHDHTFATGHRFKI
jgi:hypothetical protein